MKLDLSRSKDETRNPLTSPVERAKQYNVKIARMELLRYGVADNNDNKIFMDAKPRVAQHVGNRPRLLLVGETRSVGTRATELRSNMTADKNPLAQSKQNTASMNLWFTALGVVLA